MQTKPCLQCGLQKPISEYKTPDVKYQAKCIPCHKQNKREVKKRYKQRHPGKCAAISRRSASKAHYKNPAKSAERRARRRARIRNASPWWVDHTAILAVYVDAKRLSENTGVEHEVDHIVPIKGLNVCGLHVPWNLRAVPAIDNHRKHNTFIEADGLAAPLR